MSFRAEEHDDPQRALEERVVFRSREPALSVAERESLCCLVTWPRAITVSSRAFTLSQARSLCPGCLSGTRCLRSERVCGASDLLSLSRPPPVLEETFGEVYRSYKRHTWF